MRVAGRAVEMPWSLDGYELFHALWGYGDFGCEAVGDRVGRLSVSAKVFAEMVEHLGATVVWVDDRTINVAARVGLNGFMLVSGDGDDGVLRLRIVQEPAYRPLPVRLIGAKALGEGN